MNSPNRWRGALTIARLNWPFYAAAALVLVAAFVGFIVVVEAALKIAFALTAAACAWFLLGSLSVSHQVYDRSDLYRWSWVERALRDSDALRFVFCHAGFDEASDSLRKHLGNVEWHVLDHFDRARMTEASIRRARRMYPPVPGTLAAPFNKWPIASESVDVVFGLFAIHELRSEEERSAWLLEARRCLRVGGRIVLVEHTRDLANFFAFGPGFLHFHSPGSWSRCWRRAGLSGLDEFRITPFVRVFVIGRR